MCLCQKHQIHFISDEVYALSVFESGEPNTVPFTSVLSIDPAGIIDRNLVHVTYAMSKDFGSAGLRLGALITKNEQLKKALIAVVRFHSSSGPSIAIGTAMLEDREWRDAFISKSRQRIALAYQFVTSRLKDLGIHYMPGSNAAFFIWIDLSPYLSPETEGKSKKERECELAKRFVDAKVFLQPDEERSSIVGWFRMVYTFDRDVVEEGLKR
jgi:aspartate/methionine/tyrosine aminotransferase